MVKIRRKKLNENTAGYSRFWDNPAPFQYEVIGMNKFLEQPGNELSQEFYVNVGSLVKGNGYYDNSKVYTGIIKEIHKNELSEIEYIIILDQERSQFVKLSLDNLKLIR